MERCGQDAWDGLPSRSAAVVARKDCAEDDLMADKVNLEELSS